MLIRPDFELPATALENTVLTPLQYAEQIRPVLEALEAALDAVDDQRRVTENGQKVKAKAFEASRKTIVYGSRLLEALFILSGEEFHAARLRPNVSSVASTDEDPFDVVEPDGEEPPSDGEEPPDGEEPVGEEPASEDGESPGSSS